MALTSPNSYVVNGDPANSISDVPTYTQLPDQGRITQQKIAPAAINNRALGTILTTSTPPDQTFLVPNGTYHRFQFSVNDPNNQSIQATPDITLYIGIASVVWPSFAFNPASLPVTVIDDYQASNASTVVTNVSVFNNTGADQQITVTCRYRVVTGNNAQLSDISI